MTDIPAEKKDALDTIIDHVKRAYGGVSYASYACAEIRERLKAAEARLSKEIDAYEELIAEADSRERAAFDIAREVQPNSGYCLCMTPWKYKDFDDFKARGK